MNNLLTQSFEIARANHSNGQSGNSSPSNATDLGIDSFFQKVTEIENHFSAIAEQLHKLQAGNEKSHCATKASENKAIKKQMERDIDEVGVIALKVKTCLEQLDKDNISNRQRPGCEKGTGIDRSRLAMTMALKKKFKERMDDFQILRKKIQDDYREDVERRVFTVTGTRPDEETIDHLIDTGNSEQIFAKAIHVYAQGRGQILNAVAEIQERHDIVVEIEKKLLNLHQMFLDLSVLVEAQGDMLDDIEAQVSSSVDHVQSATVALNKAKKLQRNKRKYTCIAVFILLIVVIIVLIPVLKKTKIWGKNGA